MTTLKTVLSVWKTIRVTFLNLVSSADAFSVVLTVAWYVLFQEFIFR